MSPLAGLAIVVTRARQQASTLVERLRELGATTIEVPVIAIAPAPDAGAGLAAALREPIAHEWLVVTSANGADALLHAASGDNNAVDLTQRRIAVVGPATADRLRAAGIEPALIPERFVAEGLLDAFPDPPARGGRVLLAQADAARDVLAVGLRECGWEVDTVVAYRTVPADVPSDVRAAVSSADAITFTSASTVRNFVSALGADAVPRLVASIGPITTAAARELNITVTVEADPHTIDGLVAALLSLNTDADPRSAQ